MTCFQKGTLKLQAENSQVNATFIQTVNILRKFTISNTGKVGFPHNTHNCDQCSFFYIADTTCNGGIVESKLGRKTKLPFITLEVKNVQFSALLGEAFALTLPVNCFYVLGNHAMCQIQGQGLLQNMWKRGGVTMFFPFLKQPVSQLFHLWKTLITTLLQLRKLEVLFMILTHCYKWHDFLYLPAVWVFMWILWEENPQRVFAELCKTNQTGNQSWFLLGAFWHFANNCRHLYFTLFLTMCSFYSYSRTNIRHTSAEGYWKSTI